MELLSIAKIDLHSENEFKKDIHFPSLSFIERASLLY